MYIYNSRRTAGTADSRHADGRNTPPRRFEEAPPHTPGWRRGDTGASSLLGHIRRAAVQPQAPPRRPAEHIEIKYQISIPDNIPFMTGEIGRSHSPAHSI